jgi:hypothetical protein
LRPWFDMPRSSASDWWFRQRMPEGYAEPSSS